MDTLIAAVKSGDPRAVESCLREPACDLDYRDADGWSALHHALDFPELWNAYAAKRCEA